MEQIQYKSTKKQKKTSTKQSETWKDKQTYQVFQGVPVVNDFEVFVGCQRDVNLAQKLLQWLSVFVVQHHENRTEGEHMWTLKSNFTV